MLEAGTGTNTCSFQLFRFDPIGRVFLAGMVLLIVNNGFQLFRFDPIGRDTVASALAQIGGREFFQFSTIPI